MKTAVITDTNSGITEDAAKALGVFTVSMPVIIDEETYYEGKSLTEETFFQALKDGHHISTSQPSPGDVMELWDQVLSMGYDEIVYIPMSSALSHSCEAAMAFAQDYDGKVQVVDNHRLSVPMKESVLHAKELSDQGLSAKEIREILDADGTNCNVYVTVTTLEQLKKGGRITPAAAMLGSLLSIHPILTIQSGRVDSFAKARGSIAKCEAKMIEAVKSDLATRFAGQDMTKLHIGAAGAGLSPEEQHAWTSMIQESFPEVSVYYDPLPISLICHCGPGAVGIGVCFH